MARKKTKLFEAEGLHFTSDLHFHHRTALKFRPNFTSVEEMNETIISNWNALVKPNDNVILNGDVAFGNNAQIKEVLGRLNGDIHLIEGNHDRNIKGSIRDCFSTIQNYLEIDVPDEDAHGGKQRIILSHFAFRSWNKHHYGSWHLYGHSHGNLPGLGKSMDIGVDCNDYTPLSYELVKSYMDAQDIHTCDHHTVKV